MLSSSPRSDQPVSIWAVVLVIVLIVLNLVFSVLSNIGFKLSITNWAWRNFLVWQIIGNLAGFITAITLTALLWYIPLKVAFPLTTGLSIIGVQIVAADWLFHEAITPAQWLGTLLIVIGIWLIGWR
ncbi:MAG: hypothetical protein IVW51_09600 [Thermaceae bacterium]|nr:hypothetical protein [Thermaceae bacterium]